MTVYTYGSQILSFGKSSAKALQKLYQRLCSISAHPVYWPRNEWSTQCAGGSKGVSTLSSARSSARSFTRSPIRSSKALLTRSTNILGRFCNWLYNHLYDQSPCNRLYERLCKRPYKRPYDQSINRSIKRPYGRLYAQLYNRSIKCLYN